MSLSEQPETETIQSEDPITALRNEFQEQFTALKSSFDAQRTEMEETITKLRDENDSLHRALIRSAINPTPSEPKPKTEEELYNEKVSELAEKTKRYMSLRV